MPVLETVQPTISDSSYALDDAMTAKITNIELDFGSGYITYVGLQDVESKTGVKAVYFFNDDYTDPGIQQAFTLASDDLSKVGYVSRLTTFVSLRGFTKAEDNNILIPFVTSMKSTNNPKKYVLPCQIVTEEAISSAYGSTDSLILTVGIVDRFYR